MKEQFHKDTLLYLQGYYEILSETRGKTTKYAFEMTGMGADDRSVPEDHPDAGIFKFTSHESAVKFIEGWIFYHRKSWYGAASYMAEEAEKYQRKQRREAEIKAGESKK